MGRLENLRKHQKYQWLRRLGRVFLTLIVLLVVLMLFVRSPWGQDIIVSKVVDYVSGKTKTKVELDRLFITFSGNVQLEGLYLEDKKGDTLLYSKKLEANLPLRPLLFGNAFDIKSADWEGLNAHIKRPEGSEKFNFDFLLEAFTTTETTATKTSQPLKIDIGILNFSDFKIDYVDGYLGIDSHLKLGKLLLYADNIDLQAMRFELDDLELFDTQIDYRQTKPFPVSEDIAQTQLPYLAAKNLKIENVRAKYNSLPDKLVADVILGDFILELQKADLAQNDFEIGTLALSGSTISLEMQTDVTTSNKPVKKSKLQWPEYLIKTAKISLNNNAIDYTSKSKDSVGRHTRNLSFSDIRLEANQLDYGNKKANLAVMDFSFREKSGFRLKNFSFDAELGNNSASLSKLTISIGNSSVNGNLDLKYPSVDQLIDAPEKTNVVLDIPNWQLSLKDFFLFLPYLEKNEYLKKASEKEFTGNISATGNLKEIQLNAMEIDWGDGTSLTAIGNLQAMTKTDSLLFDLKDVKAISDREDLLRFVSDSTLGISIPKSVVVEATAKGRLNDINLDATLKIPEGTANLAGKYANKGQIVFDGNLKVDSLQLGQLMANDKFGKMAFTMKASGSGNDLNSLNAKLKADFTELTYNDYDFSKLKLNGDIQNGKGDIDLNFKDRNLDMDANAKVDLDSIASKIDFVLNVEGADLYALGVTKNPIKAALKFDADFKGNLEDFTLSGIISDGIAVSNKEQYRMADVRLSAKIGKTTTDVKVNSKFLNGYLLSNTSPNGLANALQKQFKDYFSDSALIKTPTDSVTLKVNLTLNATPILTEVIFDGVEQLDTMSARADFDEAIHKLNAQIDLPTLSYKGTKIDSLKASINGTASDMDFNLRLASVASGPVIVQRTELKGKLRQQQLALDFLSFDKQERLMHISSEMTFAKDTVTTKILSRDLILNKQQWNIPPDNAIYIADKFLGFKNFRLTQNGQELMVSNTLPSVTAEHIGVAFKDFRLQSFLSFLNPDEELVTGAVNGNLVMEYPFGDAGLVADVRIDQLNIRQKPMGNLTVKASSRQSKRYDFNLAVKDGGLDIDLTGDYIADVAGANLNLDLDLNSLQLQFIQGIIKDVIKDSNGFLSGKFKVTGTPTSPQYEGQLNFNGADFNVVALNTEFRISEETIKVNNSGIYLDKFVISDAKKNSFIIDGSILTESLTNPAFELRLVAEKFQVLNSKKGGNDLFYGQGELDADVSIKGNLDHPRINGKLSVGEGTDFTYVIPESQLNVQERDGTVIFVNRENPDDILTRSDKEDVPSIFKGLDVSTVLEVNKGSVFNIVIDERTGDNLQVAGSGDLNLNITPNGSINLAGRYELTSGHYETNLYNLVKRKFEINPGSTITWSGDPTDAVLDVTATYEVETSASPLMASVTSGGDVSVSGKYRQSLPFLVYLNVDGRLLNPKLSFGLDMPEKEQGALGGSVYDRVQQLNTQETELNKQVFSLLVMNRFFPDSGSDGSSGGATAIARNNVDKVLSDQMNVVSNKVFGKTGLEVDFGLDSYTDYQGNSPTDRTQLNVNARKKLFNDRLIISAGSAVDVQGSSQQGQTPVIGNLDIEYLLTEDGRYRLDGFQRSEYENAIDGQLTITGLALILNWEFNRLSEIFSPFKTRTNKGETKKKKPSDSKN
ncbi:MAG: translocation/assembly module TamB domain-containing protein [Maribacter sp.]|nr:translocation/assembly module TamB domain-containing protein [Maribacter sp.]